MPRREEPAGAMPQLEAPVEVREARAAKPEARAAKREAALEIRDRQAPRVAELREEVAELAERAPGLIPTQGIRAAATQMFPTLPWT